VKKTSIGKIEVYLKDNSYPIIYDSEIYDCIINQNTVKILYNKEGKMIVVNFPPANVACVVQEY
jgi:hypothetical protein